MEFPSSTFWRFMAAGAFFVLCGWWRSAKAADIAGRYLTDGHKGPGEGAWVASVLVGLSGAAFAAGSVYWFREPNPGLGLGCLASAWGCFYLAYRTLAQPRPGSNLWSDPQFVSEDIRRWGREFIAFGLLLAVLGGVDLFLTNSGLTP